MWLKNRTATWVLDGPTSYQALFRRVLDLSGLERWDATVCVHNTDGTKLDARAQDGHWSCFDM